MFTAAFYIVAETLKQLKHMNKWMSKLGHIN